MYRQFNIQQFYVLPTQCIYVFCVDLRTNSDYSPIQHQLTGFYNRGLTLYSSLVIICTASLTFSNSTFCPHSVFMCFAWIWEQTAIIFTGKFNWVIFRRFSQNREKRLLGSSCPSVCPHDTTPLPQNGIFLKFYIWIFSEFFFRSW